MGDGAERSCWSRSVCLGGRGAGVGWRGWLGADKMFWAWCVCVVDGAQRLGGRGAGVVKTLGRGREGPPAWLGAGIALRGVESSLFDVFLVVSL